MSDYTQQFIQFAIAKEVLRFGEFKTKAGRLSPYFFNSGLFNDGDSLARLGEFYAQAIIKSGVQFDMLFGPAYKGIPLVAAIAIALSRQGRNLPYAFNRKEAKVHGEGGIIVGAPLVGRVLIVDDVISAGVSVRESVEIIRAQGAVPCGVVIALDRQERGQGMLSAVQEVQQQHGIPVICIAGLADLIRYIEGVPEFAEFKPAIAQYQAEYGIS
ncbi:MAG: orotate phosphoribosyltransferase [Nitrosomonadales bacterium]|nr:MAG: orotate phosphoribosyltransferase [Nitrosomonadales bacterium]